MVDRDPNDDWRRTAVTRRTVAPDVLHHLADTITQSDLSGVYAAAFSERVKVAIIGLLRRRKLLSKQIYIG